MKISLTIPGEVPVKKNNYRISKNGGFFKPKPIVEYEELVAGEVMAAGLKKIEGKMALVATFYTANPAKDLDGMTTTLIDALQDAGLYENDKDFISMILRKRSNTETDRPAGVVVEIIGNYETKD